MLSDGADQKHVLSYDNVSVIYIGLMIGSLRLMISHYFFCYCVDRQVCIINFLTDQRIYRMQ